MSKEVASLRAAIVSLRADLEAEAARRSSDEAEAELRRESVLADIVQSVRTNDSRQAFDLQALEADIGARLTLLQAAQAAESARQEAAVEAVVGQMIEQSGAHEAQQAERDVALHRLEGRLTESIDQAATALRAVATEQTNATESLRADMAADRVTHADGFAAMREDLAALETAQASALGESVSALGARIDAASDAQMVALGDRSAELTTRIDTLDDAHAHHRAALDTANAAHAALASTVADHEDTTAERIAAALTAIDSVTSRVSSAMKRIDAAVATGALVDELADSLDGIRDRLSAAEVQLRQHDRTDLELQLDRMESFERHLAEANPDLFAAKSELDELRVRLMEIEEHVRPAAEV